MPHDIDLTITFATEQEASRFASVIELSLSNELFLEPIRFTFERKYFPEQCGRSLTLYGQNVNTRDFDHHGAEIFFSSLRRLDFDIQSARIHLLPNQFSDGFYSYTNQVCETAVLKASSRLGMSPEDLAGAIFGVSVEQFTGQACLELKDYSGDLQRMANEVFDGLEPAEPQDRQLRFFVVRDGKAVYLD